MSHDWTRAHQRILGCHGSRRSRADAQTVLPTRLVFPPTVKEKIIDELYATGHLRGGPLFGHVNEGVVTVVAAPLNGYRVLSPLLATDPLSYDHSHLLAWSDSLNYTSTHEVEWIGNWIMWPNSLLGPTEDELSWLRRGRETDLFNARYFLCTLGWEDAALSARVYSWDPFDKESIKILDTNL